MYDDGGTLEGRKSEKSRKNFTPNTQAVDEEVKN